METTHQYPSMLQFDAISFTILSLAIVFVFLRLCCRFHARALGADDILCVVALAFTIPLMVFAHMQTVHSRAEYVWLRQNGTFDHSPWPEMSDLPLQVAEHDQWAWRYGNLCVIWWGVALGCVKCSILVFYLRLTFTRSARMTIHATLGFIVLVTLWWIFINIFECVPLAAYWNKLDYPDWRLLMETGTQETMASVFQTAIDIIILVLPIPTLIKIHMPFSEKIGLMIVYGTGFVSFGATLLGLYANVRQQIEQSSGSWDTMFMTLVWSATWSNIEVCTAVICASMPAMGKLLQIFIKNMFKPSIPDCFILSIKRSRNFVVESQSA